MTSGTRAPGATCARLLAPDGANGATAEARPTEPRARRRRAERGIGRASARLIDSTPLAPAPNGAHRASARGGHAETGEGARASIAP